MARRQPRARAKFYVEMVDGTEYEVVTGDPDTMAAEDKYDLDATIWTSRPKTEHYVYLVWHAMKRKKVLDMDWPTFQDSFESVEPAIDGDDEMVTVDPKAESPTPPAE